MGDNKRCYSCGKELPKTEYHMNKMRKDGLNNECKCCASKRYKSLYRGLRRLRIQFGVIMRRAKRLGIPFHITFDEFCEWDKCYDIPGGLACPYCGLTMAESRTFQKQRGKKKVCGFTVDRIDNDKGYSLDNIQRICFLCNIIKGQWFTNQDMLLLGPKLGKLQKSVLNSDPLAVE